jgi:DNA-binding Lrp family transcriptional regulator
LCYDSAMAGNTDLKLIAALEDNGRTSYETLSRSLGVSISTVAKKVNHLVNSGIFTIKAVPNPNRIGLITNAIIGMNVSMDKIDEVCNSLKEQFNVNLVTTTFGRFNLLIAVYFKSRERIDNFLSSDLIKRKDIYETEIFYARDIRKPYDRILTAAPGEPDISNLDQTDRRLINLLIEDGRFTCSYLASQLGISISSVSKRRDRLVREDIIRIKAMTNPARIGYNANAFIFLRIDHNRLDDICAEFIPLHEVVTIMTLMNGYDIYIGAVARDSKSLYEFIKQRMKHISGIINIETLIGAEVIKRYYGPTHLEILE